MGSDFGECSTLNVDVLTCPSTIASPASILIDILGIAVRIVRQNQKYR